MRTRTSNAAPDATPPAAADEPKPSGRRRLGAAPAPVTQTVTSHPEVPAGSTQTSSAASVEPPKGNPVFDEHVQDVEERREAGRRARAADAPKTADGLSMGKHQRIVDVLFDMPDPMEVYTRVRRALSFGGRASSLGYGAIVDALDEAETNAVDAFQLLSDAKVTHDHFEMDAQVIEGSLRERATEDLQAQKDAGTRTKAITNDDVTGVMAKKFPDEYRDLMSRRSKAKRTVAVLESLADVARERARDLRAMAAKSRDA